MANTRETCSQGYFFVDSWCLLKTLCFYSVLWSVLWACYGRAMGVLWACYVHARKSQKSAYPAIVTDPALG